VTRAPGPQPEAAGVQPRPNAAGILRPKGNLSRAELAILGLVALVPLLTIAIRALALPGFVGPGLGGLRAVAAALNQFLSLSAIPADQRDHVLYLLLFPTCALLVAVARLTFGIRVLGFRSILISVAFHQSGVVPSLLLIAIAVATIVFARPWLRRIRLPYYARVSVILGIVATTMVAALLAGPWMRSDIPWGMAYFPVIVLGMLAEGIASTLDRDNVVAASWRAITTILLAFLIALVCRVPALRILMLQFPELVLTQIVAIVMVSEFLDLRLLHDWDAKIAGKLLPRLLARPGAIPVAVVRDRVEAERGAGPDGPARRKPNSVRKIVAALEASGPPVRVIEGDGALLPELRRFFPPDPPNGEPAGIVLNLAHGDGGADCVTRVPALLGMAGVVYTGPTPLGHAAAFDRIVSRLLLREAGVPTPAFRVVARSRDDAPDLRFPVIVRPRREPGVAPSIVRDRDRLRVAVKKLVRRYRQEVLVEERVTGREIRVALLGNAPAECLPLVELEPKRRMKLCPARLDEDLGKRICRLSRAAFRACGCRDYARVDVLVTETGEVLVLDVATHGILAGGGSFALAAAAAGYTFPQLMDRIVEVARERHRAGESPRPVRAQLRRSTAPAAHAHSSPIGLTSASARE